MNVCEINVADVKFRTDLYPRIETSATTVQKYAEDLDVLPPAEVNQHNELIDGWHRWTAHKKREAKTIKVIVTETASDAHLLELAIERNAAHGLQLSQEDKKNMARRIYHVTPEADRDYKKKQLARILSVSERTVRDWLSRIDKDSKEARDKRIFEMWLACYTQEETATEVSCSQPEIAKSIPKGSFAEWNNSSQETASATHATDFDIPLYNIWKQQEKSSGSKHFGNSEVKWLDNLLYLYTNPFDVVVDPFAGGGSTIDLCRKRLRRYFVSDRKPIVEASGDGVPLHKQIRQHDLTEGLPPLPRWKDVRLVYLDPPYWKQAEGQYSDDPTDLANMSLDDFNAALSGIIKDFAKKLNSAYIALIIQPTQWNATDRQFTDHIGDMLRLVKGTDSKPITVEMRFSVPYESQQCNAQMVEWAKANKKVLVLTREIIVWRVA